MNNPGLSAKGNVGYGRIGAHSSQQAVDAKTLEAAGLFYLLLKKDFGNDVEALYLFGSRARGDFIGNSDVDLAVVFTPDTKIGIRTHWRLIRSSFQLMLTYGLYLQVRPVQEGTKRHDFLRIIIDSEGVQIK